MNDRNLAKLEASLRKVTHNMPQVPTLPRRLPQDFAPLSSSPSRLANATVQSVGRIGDASAEEIEKVREELKRGYEEIDAKLAELAEAFRGHARVAERHISEFCLQATEFFDTISAANKKLQGRPVQHEPETSSESAPPDDGEPAPEFLTRADANGNGR